MTVPKKEQNAGVALLLERMKTHPEEFYIENQMRMGASKWDNLWHMYKDYFSEEDKQAYIDGLKAVNQQRFTEHVLEGLVDPKQSSGVENPHISPYLKNIASGGATPVRSSGLTLQSNGNGGAVWANSLVKDPLVQAHIDAHNAVLRKEVKKQHQTLYGKLKNYLYHEPN